MLQRSLKLVAIPLRRPLRLVELIPQILHLHRIKLSLPRKVSHLLLQLLQFHVLRLAVARLWWLWWLWLWLDASAVSQMRIFEPVWEFDWPSSDRVAL
jgi:hypothetical protein